MNKRYMLVAAVIILAGVFFYFVKTGSGPQGKRAAATAVQQAAQPVAGHQGHAAETEKSTAKTPAPEEPQAQGEAQTVEISTDSQKMIGVRTIEAAVKPVTKVIRSAGRIEYDERKISTVTTKYEGWIEKLYVDFTGRQVKKGEPLAELYSPELFATQQELINALRWRKEDAEAPAGRTISGSTLSMMLSRDAAAVVDAARQKLRLWDLTDAQIRQIEGSGTPVKTIRIFSPAGGYIVQKTAIQGMKVMPGEKLFDIADLSSVWVVSDVYEYDLPFVKTGQTAQITLSYLPGKIFSARVDYVYPSLAAETKTARVRFTLPNTDGKLKPQMFTNVEIKADLGSRLMVPEEAVIDTGVRQVVYVDKGEGNFEPREVMTGIKTDGMAEITRGLKAGEKVASSANFLIDSEAQLKGIKPLTLKK